MTETDSNFNRIESELRQLEDYITDLEQRLKLAESELSEWHQAAEVAAKGGHGDEKHCTCVPVLHNRLTKVAKIADDLIDYGESTIADANIGREYLVSDVRTVGDYIKRSGEKLAKLKGIPNFDGGDNRGS